ncbi:hypothetical protein ACFQZZ_18910 [Nocardia sp. GCM10030253]|uniref:hypothetical protein n=1 Tax=Nocardia sp. GCM10030253 TaxID=3273404 RepID=UPI003627FF49
MTSSVDEFLPSPDFREQHSITIQAPASAVWIACHQLDPRDIRLARPFFIARDVIARVLHGHGQQDIPTLGAMIRLAEEPQREIVEGLIGQWWKLGATGRSRVETAEQFQAFDEPGYAKATVSFRLEQLTDGGPTRLTTETRVHCLDAESRRTMGRYWLLIRPFSGLIRRLMLSAIRRRALDVVDAAVRSRSGYV